ncbi:MAG: phosphoenolpyruvate synthase [Thermodesulfobacteriota bacterium]
MARFIRWFDDVSLGDVSLVGGKTASLGELYRLLGDGPLRVPNGFSVTADAYSAVLDEGGLRDAIRRRLAAVTKQDLAGLAAAAHEVRHLIVDRPLPAALADEIRAAYRRLAGGGPEPAVAVRSSATAEDLPEASFAGQHESFVGVRGAEAVVDACRACIASLFTDRAVSYRIDKGFDHMAVRLSVAVQRMVAADDGASGIAFTIDPDSGFRDVVLINGAFGLGEAVVKGQLDPDEFWVFKPTLARGLDPILRRVAARKTWKLVRGPDGAPERRELGEDQQRRLCLTDDEVVALARCAVQIEQHYSAARGEPTPMDVEWARDGEDGRLYLLQARPETVHRAPRRVRAEVYALEPGVARERLVSGKAVGQRIGSGRVRLLRDARRLADFQTGEVLVAPVTDPDWEPIMKRAAAIVTDHGGRTCHAAIVSRELGVPCIVGTERATGTLRDGAPVTVSCAEGETGWVYRGALPFERREVDLAALALPRTSLMLNVANPDEAFTLAALPARGVGLARIEFIIASAVRVHPLALLHPERVVDADERRQVEGLIADASDPGRWFVDRLAEGVAMIAAAFHPRDVIVRLSDFKTNEYARLLGGASFEPPEENPMLGFRGAFRYTHPLYAEAFALECRAMRRVREAMGLDNVKIMVPFCRTPAEGERTLAAMAREGLRRGENGLEVYVMCEIPSNVLRAEEFARVFDGFSIGSNDLTQLVLGVDRDSELVAPVFDERDPAVLAMVASVIEAARRAGRKIGICGQAPSDYPEFMRFLVEHGIDSVSLNRDALVRGIEIALAAEAAAGGAARRAAEAERGGEPEEE